MKKERKILRFIKNHEGATNSDIANLLGVSDSTASRKVKKLKERGWIEADREGRVNFLYLTEKGLSHIEKHPHTGSKNRGNVQDERTTPWGVRPHNISAVAELDDSLPLMPKWFESWVEKKEKEFEEVDGGYITYIKGFKVRFTRNRAIVYIPEIVAEDVVDAKNEVMQEARDAFEYVEENSPAEIKEDTMSPRFSLSQQEIALMDDPFADTCVDSEDVDLEDQRYRDEDGDLRFHIDCSDGVPELEFVHPSFAEEDADFYREEVVGRLVENKEDWKELIDMKENGWHDDISGLVENVVRLMLIDKLDEVGVNKEENTDATMQRPMGDFGRVNGTFCKCPCNSEGNRVPLKSFPHDGGVSCGEKNPGFLSNQDLMDLEERVESIQVESFDRQSNSLLDSSVGRWLMLQRLEKGLEERLERYNGGES